MNADDAVNEKKNSIAKRTAKRAAKRANVKDRLHISTEIAPLGIGDSIASVPNRVLSQGKRQIWANASWTLKSTKLITAVMKARGESDFLDYS